MIGLSLALPTVLIPLVRQIVRVPNNAIVLRAEELTYRGEVLTYGAEA